MSRRGWVVALLLAASGTSLAAAQEHLSSRQLEDRGAEAALRAFRQSGRAAPQVDPVLTAAARALARLALTQGAQASAQLLPVAQVVSDAGGTDPTPRAIVVRTRPADYALETFSRRADLGEEAATHLGVGVALEGELAVMVALFSRRQAVLEPFPRQLQVAPAAGEVCGEFAEALRSPSLYLTLPDGTVDRVPTVWRPGQRFCAQLSFAHPGRHTVEVVGQGDFGPEVAALFFVDVGEAGESGAPPGLKEPQTVEEARVLLLERINGLRAVHGVAPLTLDSRLNLVAQSHSERMVREGFFAHVGPGGDGLRQRLKAVRYRYTRAGENLGRAAGPLAAHFAIEHSPGHRQLLLDPALTHVGLGVAYETIGKRRQVRLTEVLTRPGRD